MPIPGLGPLNTLGGGVDVAQDLLAGDPIGAYIDLNATVIGARFPVAGMVLRGVLGDPGAKRRREAELGAIGADLQRALSGLRPEVRIEGVAELRRSLRAIESSLPREVNNVLREAAGIVAREASALAPRRTGRLARSIRPYASGNRAGVGSRLPYAGLLEYGGTIEPRGVPITFPRREFTTRALERNADDVLDMVTREFDRLVARAGWR